MSGPTNPFRAPEQSAPRMKALIYGTSGVGKTYLALTAPGRIAVIDTEGGTAFYANRVGPKGLSPFDVLPTKTFAQVEQAVGYIRANPGAYETLVIDPVTVLYEVLQDAAQRRRAEVRHNADADLEMLDWQRIKAAYKRLMNDLVNLPIHVIVTARQVDLKEDRVGQNGRKEMVKIGVRPEADRSTPYYFDTVIRLDPTDKGRVAIVEKDRTGVHALNAKIPNPTFDSLFRAALAGEGTADRAVPSDDAAARVDALATIATEELHDRDETETPIGRVVRAGKVNKGDGIHSSLFPKPGPNGYAIGFLLAVEGARDRPQVLVEGGLGNDLFDVTGGDPETLVGTDVEVEGELFEVTRPGRRKLYRLRVARITGADWTFPAPDTAPSPDAAPGGSGEPTEAESEAIWDAVEGMGA